MFWIICFFAISWIVWMCTEDPRHHATAKKILFWVICVFAVSLLISCLAWITEDSRHDASAKNTMFWMICVFAVLLLISWIVWIRPTKDPSHHASAKKKKGRKKKKKKPNNKQHKKRIPENDEEGSQTFHDIDVEIPSRDTKHCDQSSIQDQKSNNDHFTKQSRQSQNCKSGQRSNVTNKTPFGTAKTRQTSVERHDNNPIIVRRKCQAPITSSNSTHNNLNNRDVMPPMASRNASPRVNTPAITGRKCTSSIRSSNSTSHKLPNVEVLQLPPSKNSDSLPFQKVNNMEPKSTTTMKNMISNSGGIFCYICGMCYSSKFSQMTKYQGQGSSKSNKQPRDAACQVMVHISGVKVPVLVRPRPTRLHPSCKAKLCYDTDFRCGSECSFAHNLIEVEVWNLGRVSYDAIVDLCSIQKSLPGYFCSYCRRRFPGRLKLESNINSQEHTQTNKDSDEARSCSYCKRTFQKKWQLENHINTREHRTNMNSDKERPWRYRDPPENIINGKYALCPSINDNVVSCPFSDVVPADNPCTRAHSADELEEWRERHQYRQMKISKAKQQNIFSFMNQLQAEYGAADFEIDVITEDVPTGVAINCKSNLLQDIQQAEKGIYTYTWIFNVECSHSKPLIRVGLLYDEYRLHFYLSSPKDIGELQVCPGSQVFQQRSQGSEFNINVVFKSRMLGRFKQWVVLDFGVRPVVKREITVDVHIGAHSASLKDLGTKETKAWDETNARIIPFDTIMTEGKRRDEQLYKLSDFFVESEGDNVVLTKDTYKQIMHQLLREEESVRQIKLAKFSMETEMAVTNMVSIDSARGISCVFAQDGQLFGEIDIAQSTFGDSDASQIALTSVELVLIKFNLTSSTVYEAQIILDEADGRTKDTIYVRLAATCVQNMKLATGTKCRVQIQFRLNRSYFRRMHWAVDQMSNTDILFPSKNEHPALICPQDGGFERIMNRWQEGAVRFIREKGGLNSKTPLLLLYGPFGTGKTYTLANGVMSALTDTDTRILICTHTNSAADLYITEYLDKFLQDWTEPIALKMLRIYFDIRSLSTIPEKVHQYLLLDNNNCIKMPDESDIRGKRIIVTTTTTADTLASFPRLRGYFTHILIDEVAQVFETEALIPLILATPETCVVLAGDHIQTGPKVYSKQARKMKFHHSLLERLFDYCLRKKCHRQILLSHNYRTHQIILTFLSKVFYSAEDLEACGNQPRHPVHYPLEFRAVKGYDMMIENSYVNDYEVSETVNRVQEILDKWPEAIWGPKAPGDIGVLTPYRLQVQKLRQELRHRGLPGVFVDRLQGVQGKQFRVVIINTVRTQATINKKDDDGDTQYYLGFLSDMRQLNTAFTRTQSLVVVVGNPVALCSIGECCTVWKKYIKECEQNQSLYGTAYKDIRLEISTATTILNPNAASFTPMSDGSLLSTNVSRSGTLSDVDEPMVDNTINQDISDDENDDIDYNRDDVIIEALRRQIRKDRRRKDGEDESSEDETEEEEEQVVTTTKFRMIEEDDHVRIVDFDDETSLPKELENGKVIPCIFRMDLDGRRYAVPKESTNEITEIHIGNHTQRGTAMDGDEVLVEILTNEDAEENIMKRVHEQHKTYGKVLSIEKRAVDLTGKKLVCLADPYSDNLMVPVNHRLPKIVIILPGGKARRNKQCPGHLVVPVCRLGKTSVYRKRDIIVSKKDRPHKLFIVKWLKWNKEFHYPLGLVIDDLPPGDNKQEGLKILKQIYQVPKHDISMDLSQERNISEDEYKRRTDLRSGDCKVFSVDSPGVQDIDDTLSVQTLPNNTYKVGVHIADVSYFIRNGSNIDKAAKEFATSVYPAFDKPLHMLPTRLSTEICSLLPDCNRLTISVFLTMDESGNLMADKIERSVIRSDVQLTYDEVEKIIDGEDFHDNEIRKSIITLSRLAWGRRRTRLGKARFSYDALDTVSHPRAHTLVEEMMLLTNETVARFLLSKFPQSTPLRRQLPPITEDFQAWKEANNERIEQSVLLTHRKEILEEVLEKNKQPLGHESRNRNNVFRIMNETWQEMNMLCDMETCRQSDLRHLGGLVCSDQYYPQLAPIHSALHRILQSSEYINSGNLSPEARKHSSLNINAYTHFTSPIRRYIDIVVHRLVVAALTRRVPCHNAEEVANICHNCNIRCFSAHEFELKTHALNLAVELKQQPLQMHAVLERMTEKNIQVGFKHDYVVSEAIKTGCVGFNLLKPISKPEVKEGDDMVVMKWKERVYHVNGMPALTPHDIRANQSKKVNLQTTTNHRFTVEIPVNNWQSICRAIVNEDLPEISKHIKEVKCITLSQKLAENGNSLVEDVTCEAGDDAKKKRYYVQFEHAFHKGDVSLVQLYPTFNRGLLSPNVQLFQMTPTLDFCMEHRGKPVQCLSSVADHTPDRKDINTYKKTWLPIIDMLAAYNAVQENETVVIHGVNIEWQYHSSASLPTGSFTLYRRFCDDRHINLNQLKASGRKAAYLCIRYNGERQVSPVHKCGYVSKPEDHQMQTMTFVAHAYTWDVKDTGDQKDWEKRTLTIFFEVNQMSAPFPRTLRKSGRHRKDCTVEIIPVCYPDSRLEGAVLELDSTSSLVKNVCLLTPNDAEYDANTDAMDMKILVSEAQKRSTFTVRGCFLNNLNQPQIEAVKRALTQRFTVIQGPPGTGKTVTGAYLVYFFTEQNKQLPERGKGRPQILYCGPSNKSVDVIAEYLKNFKIPIVRVYSKGIESRDFPIPSLPSMTGKMDSKDVIMDPRHKKISLHYLIRMRHRDDRLRPNSKCEAILAYDRRFKTQNYEPDHRETSEYHKLISSAEVEELTKYQVILTTCNAAGSNRIIKGTNIIQCIVDEAGMCNEPETLIPLVSTKPLQIVLIGDHKQLRPIIQEPTARLLGMETSLLQRYARQMEMLIIQYRMHEAICNYPSNAFYDGRLNTPQSVRLRPPSLPYGIWPGDGSRPIAFCHCTGPEETLSVRTAEGNEMSKANQCEVDQVVRMAKVLVERYNISAKDIAVLSQYRLQCDKISKALEACGKSDVNVRTVIQSQGSEWNYVILSTVRSLPRVEIEDKPNYGWRKKFLGFITDENQMNVALTRAKYGFIIVGNKYLLRTHKRWKQLLDHYEENNCLIKADTFLTMPMYHDGHNV